MSTLYEYLNFLNDSNPGPGVIDAMSYRTQPVQQIDDRATGEMGIRVCVNRVYAFFRFYDQYYNSEPQFSLAVSLCSLNVT